MTERIDTILGLTAVQRLRELVGDRTDVIVAVDSPEGELQWVSEPGARWMFGRTLSDFKGTSRFDYVHPDDAHTCRRKYEQALAGETVRYSVRAMTAEGDWREMSTVMWQVQGESEPLIVSITVPTDIEDDPL